MNIEKSQAFKLSRAIRLPDVCSLTSMSRASVWRRVHDDPTFPKPFKLSPGITVWNGTEVLAWLAMKQAHRDPRKGTARFKNGTVAGAAA